MSVEYQRDDRRRLITVVVTDPFSFDELLAQTARQWEDDAWEFAVLYDSRASMTIIPASGLRQLVDQTQLVGGGRPRGPVGLAIARRSASLHGVLHHPGVAEGREIEVLITPAQVEGWLLRHAPRRAASSPR